MSTKELHNIGEFRAYPSNLEVLTPDGVASVSLDGLIHIMTPEEAREFADEAADRIGILADCDITTAPDYAGPYYVARIRSFYGPSEEMEIVKDDRGFDPEPFDTVEEALEWIDDAEDGVYELAHNEVSSPEYLVVDQETLDWLELDDCGKYDWPEDLDALHDICDNWHDPDDANPDGYACGNCDGCIEWMRARDIEYVRALAVSEE